MIPPVVIPDVMGGQLKLPFVVQFIQTKSLNVFPEKMLLTSLSIIELVHCMRLVDAAF